jgi:hypothetical protein
MSGVVMFPDGTAWFVNGWGWRTLLERAIGDAARSSEAASLEVNLHSHGLSLDRLDQPARVRVAKSLVSSAQALRDEYQTSADPYEIGYASSLSELIEMLETEMK